MELENKIVTYSTQKLIKLKESIMTSDGDVELKAYYIDAIDRRLHLHSHHLIEYGEILSGEIE